MPDLCAAVALGQLERLSEFVDIRIKVANLYREAIEGCNWLVAQRQTKDCIHSCWSYVLKLQNSDLSWYDFRDTYLQNSGDGIYAAWQLS